MSVLLSVFHAIIFLLIPPLLMFVILRRTHRHPIQQTLKQTNDVVGYYFAIAGAIFSVLGAFMLVAVFERFDDAEKGAFEEAAQATILFRLAPGLPAAESNEVRSEIRTYTKDMIDIEWPDMKGITKTVPIDSAEEHLWATLLHMKADRYHDSNRMNQMLATLVEMTAQRRRRWMRTESNLPTQCWDVLVISGLATVSFCALFHVQKFTLHAFNTTAICLLVCSLLYAVWLLDFPYQRDVTVSPEPFHQALILYDRLEQKNVQ